MYSSLVLVSVFASAVLAHMQLYYPPTFGADNNPHRTDPADTELTYPYGCCGKKIPYPCRGYLDLLGTPQGASVATWAAGSEQNFSLTGLGDHYGGSCQVSFSVDKGNTFQVATSFEGDCPHRGQGTDPAKQTFEFMVPADVPAGDAIFAWTWFNREQEFNMNCAAVTIGAPGYSVAAPGVPYNQRPGPLVADIKDPDNGCWTVKTTAEVKYPNPGPDVVPGDG
ncbi:MAG: hypothetical protein FRX48_09640 [Lasallia pustulata]|uniref:Lytic polysaccharide monooxygenase n=1 Tax=Lasallia pustulata TaxID=136370 RepID=A0A5M8PBH3_9LECA|nr:MAG: hypothetical protein FRX48_09640 [Lasallia pustulata]